MALIDASRNHFFELAKERWQAQGFDADITDILEGYRAETNKRLKKIVCHQISISCWKL